MENNIINVLQWSEQLRTILKEYTEQVTLTNKDILVIGCSTSEVIGKKIGTNSTKEVAQLIFEQLNQLHEKTGVHLAFQCCEHLNRSLVVSVATANQYGLEEVTVKPSLKAGGAMATTAYEQLKEAVIVEKIQASAGIDIGSTLIGMHLKEVVIPIRVSQRYLGEAHVTLATRRPKLIGGPRAVYE